MHCSRAMLHVSCCVAVLQGASAQLWKAYLPNSELWFG